MSKVFKIHGIRSDGTQTPDDYEIEYYITDSEGKPVKDEQGQPEIVIWLRPIPKSKHRSITQKNTEKRLNPKSRAMEEHVDWEGVQDDLTDFAVKRWKNIVGSDNLPLQCVREVKVELPGELANDLVKRASVGEVVDEKTESFRATA
jgi:hypothetical protein